MCINQSDLGERAQQVMIMRQIYESAECVVVHLGETTDTAQLKTIFPAMEELAHSWLQLPRAHKDTTIDQNNLQRQYGLPSFDHNSWQSLIHLADHAWFRRAWTFQEILVARTCLFVSGDWTMMSNNLLPVFQVMQDLRLATH